MEHAAAGGTDLGLAVALLAAGVVAVPLFRLLGLGAVLGYLTAGVLVGPFALKLFNDSQAVLHIAEFGVVMFLFLIGLEMRPAKLWAMRKDIFGLGLAQVLVCGALLSGVGIAFGLPAPAAVIGAFGFVLSSTAVIMKMMEDRGEVSASAGQRSVAILLFEDLAIIPLLA
ncbi:MAG: cation:proton antiporter, partial [Hyphomonadaceae bacterium]